MAKQQKVEWHSIEHIPLPGGAVYVLYPTDELDPNQNPIRLFLSPIQLIYLVLSSSVRNFLWYSDIFSFFSISINFRNFACVDHLTLKLNGSWIQRPDLKMLFKFLVNRMKIEDFIKIPPNWPFGLFWPFSLCLPQN